MNKTILILYCEIMGYTLAGLKALSANKDINVYIIGRDKKKLTPFHFESQPGINYIPKSSFKNNDELVSFCKSINPSVIFVCSWHVRDYMKVAKYFFNKGITTVCMFDQQWYGTAKQWLGRLTSPIFLKRHFKYMWGGSGVRQFDFARKMGFSRDNIYLGFYTCDFDLFSSVERTGEKNILFAGRFVSAKGIDILINAFNSLKKSFPEWTLTLVGNGDLNIQDDLNIIIKPFKQPEDLKEEFSKASIFCLPSIFEPWGVVLHEAAAAGLPIICSSACGAGTTFVVNGYNGYVFDSTNEIQLANALKTLMSKSEEELALFGQRSRLLSHNWHPEIWASTIKTIVDKHSL